MVNAFEKAHFAPICIIEKNAMKLSYCVVLSYCAMEKKN